MKTIIAGSRSIWSYPEVEYAIAMSGFDITTVICGMASGVDTVGWAWAHVNSIPIIECPADWEKHGKPAGFIRNVEMVAMADALVAIHDGYSKGTAHTMRIAQNSGLAVYIHKITPTFCV